MRPWQAALLAAAATLATVGFLACLDATPVTLVPQADAAPPPVDAVVDASTDGPHDAAAEAEAEAGPSPCVKCLETPDKPGPGCGDELAACMANTKCAEALGCAIAKGCFDQGSNANLIGCGFPCAQEAGITTLTDPALQLAYNVFHCVTSTCGRACQLGAGSE